MAAPRGLPRGPDQILHLKEEAKRLYLQGRFGEAVLGYSYAIAECRAAATAAAPPPPRSGCPPTTHLAPPSVREVTTAAGEAPLLAVLYCNRCAAFLKLNNHAKALADAEAAVALDQTMYKAFYRKALAEYELKKYYEAAVSSKAAIRLDKSSKEAKQLLLDTQQAIEKQAAAEAAKDNSNMAKLKSKHQRPHSTHGDN
eukprot:SM000303S11777  [mRNA]  locus=s303:986:2340:+ [translate_table: standard]